VLIVGIVAFFSLFWIGSYEQKMKLVSELPFSFIFRFLGLSAIGLIGIVFLILFNYLNDKLILKNVDVFSLKKLAVRGAIVIILVALIGTILFFFS
jgi:hypothetical protein